MKDISELLNQLKIRSKDLSLYQQAFTHVSFANQAKSLKDYEKLEFLGDAIINEIVSEYLYKRFPNSTVGDISKRRALITQGKTETEVAKELNFIEYINFVGDRKWIVDSILEDVYESFVGALYLDLGKNITKEFILKTIVRFSNEKPENLKQDYKTMLQELVYKIFKTTPVYKQTKNNNVYNTKLFIKNKQYSEANDKKTKEAEQKAAKIAFNLLKN